MTQHAIVSSSTVSRIFKCLGSAYMKTKLPEKESSEAAEEGTQFHDLVEKSFTDYLYNGFSLDEALKIHTQKPEVGEEMCEHVAATCTEMKRQLEQVGPKRIKKIGLEERFYLSKELDIHGIVDFAYIVELEKERVLVIWDHKYGNYLVEAEGNLQLIFFAAAINATEGWGPIDRAVMHVNQPRVEHEEGTIRRAKILKEDIEKWASDIIELGKKVQKQIENGTPTFNPGPHCHFCVADGVCAAQVTHTKEQAAVDFLPTPERKQPKLPAAETLTLEQKEYLVLYKKQLEKFLAAVQANVQQEMEAGIEYPQLKLVKKQTSRRWVKDLDAVIKALQEAGIADPFEKKPFGLTTVKKELGPKKAEEIFANWTEKPDGGYEAVPLSDRRKAVKQLTGDPEEDFEDESSGNNN